MSRQFDEHRHYLDDTARLSAFDRAIRAVVRPGDVVADLGCGSGILGLMAVRAGAARVYAIDDSGMVDVARRLAHANGVAGRVVHIAGLSTRVDLPEPVDVVLADQMGHLGFEAGVLEYFDDAARRWLRPGGRLLPGRVTTWLAPVEAPEMTAVVDFWRVRRPAGFDVSAVHDGAVNTGYPTRFSAPQRLAPGQPLLQWVTGAMAVTAAHGRAVFRIERTGMLSGLAGWFVADLADAVTLTNEPGAPDQIDRRQAFLPLAAPIRVERGDDVDVTLLARPAEVVLVWDVTVSRSGRVLAHGRYSTLTGMLLSRHALARTDPTRRPRLTAWAGARATILALCDGRHTLAEIETATAARHPDLFPSLDKAAEFVAEVVTRYGRDDDAE